MTSKTRNHWSTEDSQKEMLKLCAGTANAMTDKLMQATQESLSENMWYFVDTIGARATRYREAIKQVASKNPNKILTPEQMKRTLDLENEDQYLRVHLRRYVVVADEDKDASSPLVNADEGEAQKTATAEGTKEDNAKTNEKEEDDDDDDDDDDEDDYDAIEEFAVAFPDKKELVAEMKRLKQAGTELATVFDGISDWISLSIPDIMIDDNDSVDVMKTVLETTQSHCEAIRGSISFQREYLDERSDLEIDVLTYPHSSSLRRQLLVTDLDSWDDVDRGWQTLLRCSLIIHTLLTKNMKKLLNPRNNSRDAGIYQ